MVNKLIKPMSEEFAEYLRDESRTIGKADSISFPKNEREIVEIIQELYSKVIPITLQGARTGLAAGAVPKGGHIMNLSKMDKITSMRKDEKGLFHVSVQPGTILSNLKESISGKKFDTTGWSLESKNKFSEYCNTGFQS